MNTPWKIDERCQHIWKRVYINFPTFLRLEMFHNTGMLCLRFFLECPLLLSIQLCLWGSIMDCKGLKVAVCEILSGSWESVPLHGVFHIRSVWSQLRSRGLTRWRVQKGRDIYCRVLLSSRSPVREHGKREEIGYRPAHRIHTRSI
jgi:hypothetical protein